MRRILALVVSAGLCAAAPAFAQGTVSPGTVVQPGQPGYEPIPVPADEPAGSSGLMGASGASLGSAASTGSAAVGLVGLAVIVLVGVGIAASN